MPETAFGVAQTEADGLVLGWDGHKFVPAEMGYCIDLFRN
jgi:hypothetical protein